MNPRERRCTWVARTCGLLAASAAPTHAQVATPTVVVEETALCPSCRVISTNTMRFTAASDTNLVDIAPSAITTDARGRFWIGFEGRALQVHDADGRFVRSVGRFGQGPGEFAGPDFVLPLPGDSMLVLDMRVRRATVLTPDGQFARQLRMPHQLLFPVVRSWPTNVVVSARIGTPSAAGHPLHAVSFTGTEVVVRSSFGPADARLTPREAANAYHLVAGERNGRFVSTSPVRYLLHRWRGPAAPVSDLARRSAWFGDPSSGRIGTPDVPPSPKISALHVDAEGRIWVFVRVAAPGWRAAWSRFPAGAQEADRTNLDASLLFRTIVEVIDPSQRRVLVRDTLSGTVNHVLPGVGVRVLILRPRPLLDAEIVVESLEIRPR